VIDWQTKIVAPCARVFGQPATITWKGQAFPQLSRVFDEAYSQVDVAEGMPVTTVRPCLGINTADVDLGGQPLSALQGALVIVLASPFPGGSPAVDTAYIVQEARADGHGWARLMLNLAPASLTDSGEVTVDSETTTTDESSGGEQDL
jgi:hypothetical protein